MKILVDENIPAAELFNRLGEVRTIAGRAITAEQLVDIDALMIRSVTQVNRELLASSQIKFVGTATAGTDHIDQQALRQQGITFAAAAGCNAIAVVEYVLSCLWVLGERQGFDLRDKQVGILGIGQVGSRLQQRLHAIGVSTLLCDPPRAANGESGPFCSLETLVAQADILTLHTPLIRTGKDATQHLINRELLASLPADRILINAARGKIIDNHALLQALEKGQQLTVALDVWENEPDISLPLLEQVAIATPHIAGYSLEGKLRGTLQVYQAFCRFLGHSDQVELAALLPQELNPPIPLHQAPTEEVLKRLAHLVYDVRHDDANFRSVASKPGQFDALRKAYRQRREWSSLRILPADHPSARLLQQMGFTAEIF